MKNNSFEIGNVKTNHSLKFSIDIECNYEIKSITGGCNCITVDFYKTASGYNIVGEYKAPKINDLKQNNLEVTKTLRIEDSDKNKHLVYLDFNIIK